MGDLTIMQRILRPVLNWTVERYFPRGAFFGREYLISFERISRESTSPMFKTPQAAAASYLMSTMTHQFTADSYRLTAEEVTINGDHVGTWQFIAEKVAPPAAQEGGDA